MNTNTATARRQEYDRHHRDEDYFISSTPAATVVYDFHEDPPPTTPAAAQPAQVISMPQYRGRFQKGYDPRRHQLTPAECSKGFWKAIESIITRYPDAVMSDGRHIACNFLRSKNPQYFETRQQRAA